MLWNLQQLVADAVLSGNSCNNMGSYVHSSIFVIYCRISFFYFCYAYFLYWLVAMFVIVNSYVAFCCTVIDIFWESTLVFFVTYKPADSGSTEQPWLVQVTLAVSKQILPLLGRIACTECWDGTCSYRCSVVCLMDTAMSPAKWLNRDAVWVMDSDGPKEPCVRCWLRIPRGRGSFFGVGYM